MHVLTEPAVDRFAATPGTVHLVGAGPGDPGLLTLRAAGLLATADVVFHDQLVTPEVLALVDLRAEVVPVGRRCGDVVVPHQEVVRRMAGVTSAIAGPAAAGIPITHRGVARGFLAVTAHTFDGTDGMDWDTVARFPDTVVVMMGKRRWHDLTNRLVAHGRRPDEPAAAIAWATTPRQQVVTATLATIATVADDGAIDTPALLVLGDVVDLRHHVAARSAIAAP